MNNRKRTSGRKIIHVVDYRIIGYTVLARFGGENYKGNENYKKFVEVVAPKELKPVEKVKTIRLSDKAKKALKLEKIYAAEIKAYQAALKIAEMNKFDCIILPKHIYTSTVRNLSL
ncbi:MAG: hypothetical protein WAQ28_03410 [Bacteroidia bacterium]